MEKVGSNVLVEAAKYVIENGVAINSLSGDIIIIGKEELVGAKIEGDKYLTIKTNDIELDIYDVDSDIIVKLHKYDGKRIEGEIYAIKLTTPIEQSSPIGDNDSNRIEESCSVSFDPYITTKVTEEDTESLIKAVNHILDNGVIFESVEGTETIINGEDLYGAIVADDPIITGDDDGRILVVRKGDIYLELSMCGDCVIINNMDLIGNKIGSTFFTKEELEKSSDKPSNDSETIDLFGDGSCEVCFVEENNETSFEKDMNVVDEMLNSAVDEEAGSMKDFEVLVDHPFLAYVRIDIMNGEVNVRVYMVDGERHKLDTKVLEDSDFSIAINNNAIKIAASINNKEVVINNMLRKELSRKFKNIIFID